MMDGPYPHPTPLLHLPLNPPQSPNPPNYPPTPSPVPPINPNHVPFSTSGVPVTHSVTSFSTPWSLATKIQSCEHAYQYSKACFFDCSDYLKQQILKTPTALASKRVADGLPRTQAWDDF